MTQAPASRSPLPTATLWGLFLALIVPTGLAFLAPPDYGTRPVTAFLTWGIVLHWANLAAVIGIVILAERLRLASIGLRSLRWWTLPLGLLAGVIILPIAGFLSNAVGASADARFAAFLQSLPFITRLLLVLTAGIFEETLFRGYALERLASWLGSKWWAAAVTVAMFTLAHIPAVGLAHLAPVLIVSVLITLLYLWRRDLMVNIAAHVTIDAIGLLLVPILRHHGAPT
jgi:membrane protease YdiL (CAAX protease family)